MSDIKGKRITMKRKRPNPLFQEWLEELYEEAREKKSKLESMLKKALESITSYPLPLESGAECAVLDGFDDKLCSFLDKRLQIFNSAKDDDGSSQDENSRFPSSTNDKSETMEQCPSKRLRSYKESPPDELIESDYELLKEVEAAVNEVMFNGPSTSNIQQALNNIGSASLHGVVKIDEDSNDSGVSGNEKCPSVKSDADSEISQIEYIEMESDTFDVILLIDKHELNRMSRKKEALGYFNKYPKMKYELRDLKIGDFAWVARHRDTKQELVLPYVVERKRMDDLASSIIDGRYHEQKFRLRKCGLNHIIYLIESCPNTTHVGLPMSNLMQALANTMIHDGFKLHQTSSLLQSVVFLVILTKRLYLEYKDKCIKGSNKAPDGEMWQTFDFFNKAACKNKPLSVRDTFIKMLLQLKGMSVEKVLAITEIYKTPASLIKSYKDCNQKEGETLLANLKFGAQNRNIGPSLSKTVYQLFSLLELP